MNGLLLLGVFHVAKLVIIGLPLYQEVADLLEPVISTVMQGIPLAHVLSINVRATSEKEGE